MIPQKITKQELFNMGVELSRKFLSVNDLYVPTYVTYEEVFATYPQNSWERRCLERMQRGPGQGYGTGYYNWNTCFVNLKKAAHPVMRPGCSSWSFPCYKIDREPCGVVAHETGHHVDKVLGYPARGTTWARVVKHSQAITSYEPNLDESWAETLRLFILNPDLLRQASTPRYKFVTSGLKPSETRDFRAVLDHPTYIAQAERWIAKQK